MECSRIILNNWRVCITIHQFHPRSLLAAERLLELGESGAFDAIVSVYPFTRWGNVMGYSYTDLVLKMYGWEAPMYIIVLTNDPLWG